MAASRLACTLMSVNQRALQRLASNLTFRGETWHTSCRTLRKGAVPMNIRCLTVAALLLTGTCALAVETAAPPYWPPVIWSGTSYLDVRQFAALAPCAWTQEADGLRLKNQQADVLLRRGGECVLSGGAIQHLRRGPFSYGEGMVFVPARALLFFGHRLTWIDKTYELVVDDTQRLQVFDPASFFAVVPILCWYPDLPSQRAQTSQYGGYTSTPTQIPVERSTLAPSLTSGGGTVYGTRTGEKYHAAGCQYLRQSAIPMSRAAAIQSGLTPCSRCNP